MHGAHLVLWRLVSLAENGACSNRTARMSRSRAECTVAGNLTSRRTEPELRKPFSASGQLMSSGNEKRFQNYGTCFPLLWSSLESHSSMAAVWKRNSLCDACSDTIEISSVKRTGSESSTGVEPASRFRTWRDGFFFKTAAIIQYLSRVRFLMIIVTIDLSHRQSRGLYVLGVQPRDQTQHAGWRGRFQMTAPVSSSSSFSFFLPFNSSGSPSQCGQQCR